MAVPVAVLAVLPLIFAGCAGVSQGQLDEKLNQRSAELKAYADQRVNSSEAAMRSQLTEVRAEQAATRTGLSEVKVNSEQNREVLRTMLTAQMQALEQEKRVLDQLMERLGGTPVASASDGTPGTPAK
jgi:hypothetical protein